MNNIFFLKDASKSQTDPNSIILRYRIASTKKYKVKGLGIKATKKDWDQENQKVKRSNPSYQLWNKRISFIQDEINRLEESKGIENITPDQIDNICKASISGVDVTEVVNEKELLTSIIKEKISEMEQDQAMSEGNCINYGKVLTAIEKFEKETKEKISISYLTNNSYTFKTNFINFRRKTVLDETIKDNFKKINATISWYNRKYNKSIKTIDLKATQWLKHEKEVVFLTMDELRIFYRFVNNPLAEEFDKVESFNNSDIKYIVGFLFRCFSGMRIQDMNSSNINENKVLPLLNTQFIYYQSKGDKECKVPFIGDLYLYNLASLIRFDFPDFTTEKEVMQYARKERETMRYFYGKLIKAKRNRKTVTNKGIINTPLEKCLSSHSARKTFAKTIIYDSFKDIYYTSKLMGHMDIKTTLSYLGINEDQEFIKYQDLKLNI